MRLCMCLCLYLAVPVAVFVPVLGPELVSLTVPMSADVVPVSLLGSVPVLAPLRLMSLIFLCQSCLRLYCG